MIVFSWPATSVYLSARAVRNIIKPRISLFVIFITFIFQGINILAQFYILTNEFLRAQQS